MWIESHTNLARHPKTRRLMKLLGWSLPDTIGNLHLFWYWALDFAPTGDLTPYTPEELTADLDLLGSSPDQFIEAMVQAGFLDRIADTLTIHDWIEHKRPRPRRNSVGSSRPAVARQDRPAHRPSPSSPPEDEANILESQPESAVQSNCDNDPHSSIASLSVSPCRLTPSVVGGHDAQLTVAPPRGKPQQAVQADSYNNTDRRALPSEPFRPAVAGHYPRLVVPPRRDWWPLYLDFHEKAETPLTKDAQAKFLAQLAQNPLSAVRQIKAGVTHTVRSGILEHAP